MPHTTRQRHAIVDAYFKPISQAIFPQYWGPEGEGAFVGVDEPHARSQKFPIMAKLFAALEGLGDGLEKVASGLGDGIQKVRHSPCNLIFWKETLGDCLCLVLPTASPPAKTLQAVGRIGQRIQ
jgi:hypothetical protein